MHFLHLACLTVVIVVVPCANAATQTATKPSKQSSSQDWDKLVKKANTHRRLMLRNAISKKVVAAGDAAVPAVYKFTKTHGRNKITLGFVDAYSKSNVSEPRTLALLEDWARDRDFYWRGQALGALANRRLPEYRPLFLRSITDAAFLTRIHAGRGLCLLGKAKDRQLALALLQDDDPRVRLRIALTLVAEGDLRGLPELVEALNKDNKFLSDPWGLRGAQRAMSALKKMAGKDFGYDFTASREQNATAIAAFRRLAKDKLGDKWRPARPTVVDATEYLGGVEVRSCRNGDLFLRWTQDGTLARGLEPKQRIKLTAASWKTLRAELPAGGDAIHGKVVCDYLRVMCENPGIHWKSAPGALPQQLVTWLNQLARALEKEQQAGLARAITDRLGQFASGKRQQR
jgi:hypothetical protein